MQRLRSYLNVLCPAKINLLLRIGPLRRDGYHELETLMVPLSWGDRISLKVKSSKVRSIRLRCPDLKTLAMESNLAYRAAEAFCREFRKELDIEITLKKLVPTGAGLGGGSSDAAMVLKLLSNYCGLRSKGKLMKLASKLGADVPFFLLNSAAWCTGFGEKCKALRLKRPLYLVLVHSRKHPVPTAWAYKTLDSIRQKAAITDHLSGMPRWMEQDWEIPELENDFEPLALRLHPRLQGVSRALCRSGAHSVRMSGSGSSFFGLYSSARLARQAALDLRKWGFEAHFCTSLK